MGSTELAGLTATVITAIPGPGEPGEVVCETPGGRRMLIAYADEPVPKNASVVIYQDRGVGRVDVGATSV